MTENQVEKKKEQPQEKKMKGDGHLYLRGRVWWCQYYDDGKHYNESTGEQDWSKANKVLQDRLSDIRKGRFVPPDARKLTIGQVIKDLVKHYEVNGRRSLARAKRALRNVTAYFGDRTKVRCITASALDKYAIERLEEGAANATIQYELALVRCALNLKARAGELDRNHIPAFPQISVNNTRQGYFSDADFLTLVKHLPADLQAVVTFAYWTGWRIKSEIMPLRWSQVDFEAGLIRLEPGTTKSGEGREFPFTGLPALADLLRRQRAKASARKIVPAHVFFREQGRAAGRALAYDGHWQKSWTSACVAAGLGQWLKKAEASCAECDCAKARIVYGSD